MSHEPEPLREGATPARSGMSFETLSLMGGEPTLHPQPPEILRLAWRYLPDTPITATRPERHAWRAVLRLGHTS